jgi:hypothetical protein
MMEPYCLRLIYRRVNDEDEIFLLTWTTVVAAAADTYSQNPDDDDDDHVPTEFADAGAGPAVEPPLGHQRSFAACPCHAGAAAAADSSVRCPFYKTYFFSVTDEETE